MSEPSETDEQAGEVQVGPTDAVIILKSTDEQGNISTTVEALGEVQPTEVQTLIELGLQSWRQRLGLPR